MSSAACVVCTMGNSVSSWFLVQVGLLQTHGCLVEIHVDGVVREVNARILGRRSTLVNTGGKEWNLNQLADCTRPRKVATAGTGI